MSSDRKKMIFIDVETTGLDWALDHVIELAYMPADQQDPITLFPFTIEPQDYATMRRQHGEALDINKFDERYPDGVEYSGDQAILKFIEDTTGAMLVGANVRFDARMIENTLRLRPEPWHHRLFDLQAYAAGVLRLPQPIGWAEICERVIPDLSQPDHSAAGDTRTVAQVYDRLVNWAD